MRTRLPVFAVVAALAACGARPQSAPTLPPPPVVAPPPEPAPPALVTSEDAAVTPAPVDAAVEAPAAPVFVGLRTIAFRAGARPPRGDRFAHGDTAWSVMLAAASLTLYFCIDRLLDRLVYWQPKHGTAP